MKRIWISLSILAVVFAAALANSWYLDHLTEDMAHTLAEAQALAETEDWEGGQKLTAKALEQWEKASDYLYIVVRHSDSDEVAAGFREVGQLLEWKEEAEYTSANARLIEEIRLLADMEQFTLRNLL